MFCHKEHECEYEELYEPLIPMIPAEIETKVSMMTIEGGEPKVVTLTAPPPPVIPIADH